MKPYNKLHIHPYTIAETICGREYKGEEFSAAVRNMQSTVECEGLRRKMTPEDVQAFAEYADECCKKAYDAKTEWFQKIIRSKTNAGRNQLFIWITHWLASWLKRRRYA